MSRQQWCMRSAVSTAVLLAAFLLVACPWDAQAVSANGQKAAADSAKTATTHNVLISGFKFQPDNLTVKVGETVEWKNADNVPHTVTADGKEFDSGSIRPGASWKFVATKAGTYNYICTLHPNMKAKLTVQ